MSSLALATVCSIAIPLTMTTSSWVRSEGMAGVRNTVACGAHPQPAGVVAHHCFPSLVLAHARDGFCAGVRGTRGSFGTVYKAVDRLLGEEVAVKVMDRTKIKAASIERELTVLEHLGRNPYVVQFKGSYITPTTVSFVMEL